jgi:putative tryptophan/tyrosine transport system substrate-binding protein
LRRREFIQAAIGSVLASPIAARAQPVPVIGYLSSLSEDRVAAQLAAFRRGLAETGFVEGRNLVIDYRWADGHFDRLPAMADELVRRAVSLILAQAPPAALAAKAATANIPIVFVVGFDPVRTGLVTSLHHPGGNATGMTLISHVLGQKRLELVREIASQPSTAALLVNPVSPDTAVERQSVEEGARSLGVQLATFNATTADEIDAAFGAIAERRPGMLLIGTDPFFLNRRLQIVAHAARLPLPTIYPFRDYVAEGGLISYGTNIANSYRQAGIYAGRILKGISPAELPVMQPTTFELVINLRVAEASGIEIPATIHARSDEVIE